MFRKRICAGLPIPSSKMLASVLALEGSMEKHRPDTLHEGRRNNDAIAVGTCPSVAFRYAPVNNRSRDAPQVLPTYFFVGGGESDADSGPAQVRTSDLCRAEERNDTIRTPD